MKYAPQILPLAIALAVGSTACQPQMIPPVSIYEDPLRFVRLQEDPAGESHSHPAQVTQEEIIAVLSGIIIEEPTSLMRALLYMNKDGELERHPAFNNAEIGFLAPLLARGLQSAKPKEIVTFYLTTQQPDAIDRVTSGGAFIDGDQFHILLSNYRSPTRYPPDIDLMSDIDSRATPLEPIAPQNTQLAFQPLSAVASPRHSLFKNPFRPQRREIVVLFKQLTAEPPAEK